MIEGSGSTDDARLIENFMTSMEPWRGLSGQVEKLFQLCRVLNDLARAYVDVKQADGSQRRSEADSGDRMASLFAEDDLALRGHQHDLMLDEDLTMANDLETWNWAQLPYVMGSQAHQVGDLFTGYMDLTNMPDFIASD